MNILVVDDKKVILERVSALFHQLGYSVVTAKNGLDALAKVQKNTFDLFVIDHLMPVMNGIQLIRNLKSKDVTEDIPVLFMTTQDTSSVKDLEEFKLIDAIISKPLDQNLFFSAVNQLLPQNSLVQSL